MCRWDITGEKKMKKLLVLVLCIIVLGTMYASDPSQTINGITYTLSASTNTATVTNTPTGSVSIPATVLYNNRTYNVTTISGVNSGITSVNIAEGVSSIGTAFRYKSSLTSVLLPSTIQRIEENAFHQCTSLVSINIPEGLTYIGTHAFQGCSVLPSITIPTTLVSMGNNVFDACENLSTITWNARHCVDFTSGDVAPFNSEYREYNGGGNGYTYYRKNNYTTSITFGEEVEYIPAFLCYRFLSLSTLVIPNSVKEIGADAFYSYYTAGPVTNYDVTLSSVVFGTGLEKIGAAAFYSRRGINSITIPDNCREIGASAFRFCTNLTSITLGKNITTIGNYAFGAASSTNPSINTINIYANTPPVINSNVFYNYADLMAITLNVRSSALAAYQSASVWGNMYVQALENDLRTFTLTVYSGDESKGITTQGGDYDEDSEVLIYAAANDGYQFIQWNDSNTDNPRIITMTGDLTYIAHFDTVIPVVTHTVIVSANNLEGTALGGGVFESGTQVSIAAVPNAGYHFSQWADGNTSNPRNILVSADGTYIALFAADIAKHSLTVMSTNNTWGTAYGQGNYEESTEVAIFAVANDGYHFTQWHDGNTDNPRIITITADAMYFANFTQDPITPTLYELNVAPEIITQGWTTEGCEYELGTQVMIYAHPAEGFVFNQWSDGNTDNPRFITMYGNVDLLAQFVDQTSTEVVAINSQSSSAYKYFIDGKVFIQRGDKTYTSQGLEIK